MGDDADEADMIGGWGDALMAEQAALTHKRNMAFEEKRLRRVQQRRALEKIDDLQLEVEDLELDLDENGVCLINEHEVVQRIQLERSDARAHE